MSQKVEHTKNKKTSPDKGLVLIVVSILLVGLALFVGDQPDSGDYPSKGSQRLSKRNLQELRERLKGAALKSELQRKKIQLENTDNNPVGVFVPENQRTRESNVLEFHQDPTGKNVLKDTETTSQEANGLTPEQQISSKIVEDERDEDYQNRANKEYVRQFLKNAQEQGVSLRLNDNLDVTGMTTFEVEKPIRVPQSVQGGAK